MGSLTFAIVGASLAGAHAAHQLRKDGFDGRVVLIGAEPHLPYDRPPLSKGVLLGETEPEATALWAEADFAAADIELVLGARATRIRTVERLLELDGGAADGGRSLPVDKILLCTGVTARRPTIPGMNLPNVTALRTLDDALRLREQLQPGARVVVIGFGFIGAEVAAAAAALGSQVSLLESAALPLQRVLGPQIGGRYRDLHLEHGVDVRLGAQVAELRGLDRCREVVLADGAALPADLVVVGIGADPAVALAETADLATANGVLVDAHCRTSVPGIYACGDVAARPSAYASGPLRLESWQNAYRQAVAAAKSMLGSAEPFDDLPWFWTDQYDVKMQMAGLPSAACEFVWRPGQGDMDGAAFYLADGVVRAVVGFNRPRDVRAGMDLIRKGVAVRPAELADASVDLRTLAAQG